MMDVSVIIPTFNRLWCLPRAIESCRNTNCKTEIIVVDDGSTDGTLAWLQQQADIKAIRQLNSGQTYAINNGFAASTGRFIRFLDSDDFLSPGIIDRQFNAAVNTGAELVCSRVDGFEEATGHIEINPEIGHWADFLEVQLGNGYGSHFLGMLFSRRLVTLTPRRPDFAFREDRMFLLEVALLNPSLTIVDGCAGYWVKHHDQMQGNYSGLKSKVVNWQHLQIYKRILGRLETGNRLKPSYKKAACTVLWPLAHWIAKDDITEGAQLVNWLYELDPYFAIPEKGFLGALYKSLGFKNTERLLNLRRFFKYGRA